MKASWVVAIATAVALVGCGGDSGAHDPAPTTDGSAALATMAARQRTDTRPAVSSAPRTEVPPPPSIAASRGPAATAKQIRKLFDDAKSEISGFEFDWSSDNRTIVTSSGVTRANAFAKLAGDAKGIRVGVTGWIKDVDALVPSERTQTAIAALGSALRAYVDAASTLERAAMTANLQADEDAGAMILAADDKLTVASETIGALTDDPSASPADGAFKSLYAMHYATVELTTKRMVKSILNDGLGLGSPTRAAGWDKDAPAALAAAQSILAMPAAPAKSAPTDAAIRAHAQTFIDGLQNTSKAWADGGGAKSTTWPKSELDGGPRSSVTERFYIAAQQFWFAQLALAKDLAALP